MKKLRAWSFRLLGLFNKTWRDRDITEEIQSHIQMHIDDNIQRGMDPAEARREALLKLGGIETTKEHYRDRRGIPALEALARDTRFGLRVLRKSPGFTITAVLTLALGVGASIALFSVVDAVALRSLPVNNPGRLVQLASVGPVLTTPNFSYPAFARVRDENVVFTQVCAVGLLNNLDANIGGETEYLNAQLVSGNFFSMLGVGPAAGRAFSAAEDATLGGNPVAVISHGYWKRRFGLDSAIVGSTIDLHKTRFVILGVSEPGFTGITIGTEPDIYVPMMMEPIFRDQHSWLTQPDFHWLQVAARLREGIGRRQAESSLATINREILEEVPKKDWPAGQAQDFVRQVLEVVPASNGLIFQHRQRLFGPLSVLGMMVALLFLGACANVANLLLARCASRRQEIAVRMALGAGRMRVIQQLLIESLIVGTGAGLAGTLLAWWSMPVVESMLSVVSPSAHFVLHPDLRVLLFALSASLLSTAFFGVVPALASTGSDVAPALKAGGPSVSGNRSRKELVKLLVVSQVAMSVFLLVGAGLFLHTFINLKSVDVGFDRGNVLMFSVDPARGGYKGAETEKIHNQLLEQLSATAGVRSASISMLAPITGGGGWDNTVSVDGYLSAPDEDTTVYLNSVGPNYFATMGITLLQGREFASNDARQKAKVAIVNEKMARYFFGVANPIGRTFGWGEGPERQRFEIVGVVKDSKYETLREQTPRTAYLDCFQGPMGAMNFAVRLDGKGGSASAIIPDVRQYLAAVGKNIQVGRFTTLEDRVDESLGHERLMATLSSLIGCLALLIASVGLYGVMSYSVSARRREVGIRLALGARPVGMLLMVLREGLGLVLIGLGIGIPGALIASRAVAEMLFEMKPADPMTFGGVSVLLVALALLSCYLPARRATRVDPSIALRDE